MQVTGNLPEALRSVERALSLDPASSNPGLYLTAAQVNGWFSYGDCQGFGRRIRLPGSRESGLHPVGLEQIKTC